MSRPTTWLLTIVALTAMIVGFTTAVSNVVGLLLEVFAVGVFLLLGGSARKSAAAGRTRSSDGSGAQ
jgi:hypothetical protein